MTEHEEAKEEGEEGEEEKKSAGNWEGIGRGAAVNRKHEAQQAANSM